MTASRWISDQYRSQRETAAIKNLPYRPYSPLVQLLNNLIIRNLVMEFFHSEFSAYFDRDIVPEDIFHIFHPVGSLYLHL